MGWINEAYPDHEGFVRGWQRVEGKGPFAGYELKEIVCPSPAETLGGSVDGSSFSRELDVHAIQVCCECGWRSPLLRAPLGTKWGPCVVYFTEHDRESERNDERERMIGAQHGRAFEKECVIAWQQHLADMLPGEFFSRKIYKRR